MVYRQIQISIVILSIMDKSLDQNERQMYKFSFQFWHLKTFRSPPQKNCFYNEKKMKHDWLKTSQG